MRPLNRQRNPKNNKEIQNKEENKICPKLALYGFGRFWGKSFLENNIFPNSFLANKLNVNGLKHV